MTQLIEHSQQFVSIHLHPLYVCLSLIYASRFTSPRWAHSFTE